MPLYEYRCKQCGNRYEKIQKISETPDTVCPKCGGPVERPLTAPALQFKGSGWYINDYAAKPASSSTGTTSESTSSTSESKPAAESKPASTTESSPKSSSTPGS